MTQDFFGTASFAVVAHETYSRGLRHFLEDEMGLPCEFAISRNAGKKTDNENVRELLKGKAPLVVFGSYNERMYLAENGGQSVYIPASFPGTAIRRHTGTPFMGYAGATYLVQEVCNALFDALFNILPLGTKLDEQQEVTPSRIQPALHWEQDALELLEQLVEQQPVIVRISAAKTLRDASESLARKSGAERVTTQHVAAQMPSGEPVH